MTSLTDEQERILRTLSRVSEDNDNGSTMLDVIMHMHMRVDELHAHDKWQKTLDSLVELGLAECQQERYFVSKDGYQHIDDELERLVQRASTRIETGLFPFDDESA